MFPTARIARFCHDKSELEIDSVVVVHTRENYSEVGVKRLPSSVPRLQSNLCSGRPEHWFWSGGIAWCTWSTFKKYFSPADQSDYVAPSEHFSQLLFGTFGLFYECTFFVQTQFQWGGSVFFKVFAPLFIYCMLDEKSFNSNASTAEWLCIFFHRALGHEIQENTSVVIVLFNRNN